MSALTTNPQTKATPESPDTPSGSYSLFAMPSGCLHEQLVSEIAHLAERYSAPTFPPHVTVLFIPNATREDVMAKAKELAEQVKKYRINFVEVARGSQFYQCVYLLAAKDEGTMAAAAAARRVYGIETLPYMPHLSLLYADMDESERAKIVEYETARLYDTSPGSTTRLVEDGFPVEKLSLWSTPIDDPTTQSWCMLEEFELV